MFNKFPYNTSAKYNILNFSIHIERLCKNIHCNYLKMSSSRHIRRFNEFKHHQIKLSNRHKSDVKKDLFNIKNTRYNNVALTSNLTVVCN